ncbi:hypothetical protein [Clostridium sp. Ade.TY]|uniref:hypothetical protein n=1 Tax=Clostridium sp. Ade.TY TaxID=1391647 RepID=UPI000401D12A|nr:hypothetical protein [Clostridium sp. Ade.TY]
MELDNKLYGFSVEDALRYRERTSLTDKMLTYKKENGLHKEFWIKYESDGLLYNINKVSVKHSEIIDVIIENSLYEKRIKVSINIPRQLRREYNFKETLVIYTGYDVREFSFYVQCEGARIEKNIVKLTDVLKYKKSETVLLSIVDNMNEIDDILDITRKAPYIIDMDLSIDTYLKVIKNCKDISKNDIKIALFCEELIKNKAIITNDIVESVKNMYRRGLVTRNTIGAIKYLSMTCSNNRELSFILLGIKAKLNYIDDDFAKEFVKLYKEAPDVKALDKILNLILYSDKIKYNKELIKIVFGFYRRNNDVKSLTTVCRWLTKNKVSLEIYGIGIKDRNLLVKAYRKDIIDWKELLVYSDGYYSKSIYIRDTLIKLFEDKLLRGKEKDKRFIYSKYSHIVKDLSKYNKIIYRDYIDFILNLHNRTDTFKTITLENYLNNFRDSLSKEDKNNIIKKIITFYIQSGNKEKYIKVIKENKEILKSIIYSNIKNINFIEEILFSDLRKEIEFNNELLSEFSSCIIKNKRFELLFYILEEYKNIENYDDNLFKVVKSFISNFNGINEAVYQKTIFPIYYKLSFEDKEKLYKYLLNREDLPYYFREENYKLFNINKDKKIIIDSFLNGNNESVFSKNLTLKEYFNEDDIFLKGLKKGYEDDFTINIVLEKISNKFKSDKQYVVNLCSNIKNKNIKLKNIETYARDYLKFKNNKVNKYVFEEFRITNKTFGEVCDKVEISNIFTLETESGYIFKDENIKSLIKKYLKKNYISFDEIEGEVIVIKEKPSNSIKDNNINLFLKNMMKIILIQQNLISSGYIIVDFLEDSFIYFKENIFLNNLQNISIFKYEVDGKNNKDFNIEKSSVNSLKYFINKNIKTLSLEDKDKAELIKNTITKNIIYRDKIKTYGELKEAIDEILKGEDDGFKEYKYNKYLDDYSILQDNFKDKVIELILKRSDIRKKAKSIIIYEDIYEKAREEYFKYLINCFNNHFFDLEGRDFKEIYEKIISIIKEDKNIAYEYQNEITEVFLNAPNRCNYSGYDVLFEVKRFSDVFDVDYIRDKIIS